jgi:hypothetical protein
MRNVALGCPILKGELNLMDPAVIAAIISGSIAIVLPIITYGVTRFYDRRGMRKIEGRRNAIVGTWDGEIAQEVDGKLVSMKLGITFTAGKKVIEGTGKFINPVTNLLTELKFNGGFYHEQFVKLDFTNTDDIIVQFGCSILQLSSVGRTMQGRYVAYGSFTNLIVSGEVNLRRTA